MSNDVEQSLAKLHQELGMKRLSLWWAKTEILIGLAATAVALVAPDELFTHWSVRVALFVLGLYFAMAGHRSHLYQSTNRLIAHLTAKIDR
jgi:hypothetical protein